jgi:hypothetical protein
VDSSKNLSIQPEHQCLCAPPVGGELSGLSTTLNLKKTAGGMERAAAGRISYHMEQRG